MRPFCSCETGRRGHKAHEHHSARVGISPVVGVPIAADGVGLAAVPEVWQHNHHQVGAIRALPMVSGGPSAGMGTAAPLQKLPPDLLGAVGAVDPGQLVRSGGASLCAGPLAAWGHVVAADGRVLALLAGPSRTLAAVATTGSGAW